MTEQECLAAVLAVNRFRPYMEGHEFSINTDHTSLEWKLMIRNLWKLARWSWKLQGFKFHIQHITQKDTVVADTLSKILFDRSVLDSQFSNDSHYHTFKSKILSELDFQNSYWSNPHSFLTETEWLTNRFIHLEALGTSKLQTTYCESENS